MTNEQIHDPEQSLEIITQAINGTKENIKENAWYFIFWGVLVGILCLAHYAAVKYHYQIFPQYLWPGIMLAGGVISGIRGYRSEKKESYTSYSSIFSRNLWLGIGIGYIIVMIMALKFGQNPVMPILLLSAIGTFVTGLSINYAPMTVGGVSLFVCATLALWVDGADTLLLCAIALFVGYVVPGVMLRRSE